MRPGRGLDPKPPKTHPMLGQYGSPMGDFTPNIFGLGESERPKTKSIGGRNIDLEELHSRMCTGSVLGSNTYWC